jgi:hypothetical protein
MLNGKTVLITGGMGSFGNVSPHSRLPQGSYGGR